MLSAGASVFRPKIALAADLACCSLDASDLTMHDKARTRSIPASSCPGVLNSVDDLEKLIPLLQVGVVEVRGEGGCPLAASQGAKNRAVVLECGMAMLLAKALIQSHDSCIWFFKFQNPFPASSLNLESQLMSFSI
jgi:hypothetical protein